MVLVNIVVAIVCLLIGYLFGALPTGVIIGKVFFHTDPRTAGSKNPGGTNLGRLFGKKVGLTCIIIDMIKVIIPVWVCWAVLTFIPFDNGHGLIAPASEYNNFGLSDDYMINWPVYWLAALGCTIGHCYPIFIGFKGGKGVSCFMGTILATSWMLGFLPALVFYFTILKITKHVSTASILSAIFHPLLAWIWAILMMCKVIPENLFTLPMYGATLFPSWIYALVLTLMGALVIYRHKANIQRLKEGTENKIKWMK